MKKMLVILFMLVFGTSARAQWVITNSVTGESYTNGILDGSGTYYTNGILDGSGTYYTDGILDVDPAVGYSSMGI